jgi:type I restriction enzyme M protein
MLFLLHLLSKRKPPEEGGTRIGIVLSGSPLFNGGAGSGESEIRRWILENDWLEALVALPTDMFYNTGISTYIWVLSTNKEEHRKGLVQLIDASNISTPMRKNLGSKSKWLNDEQIAEIARIHDAFEESDVSKIFETEQFGYRRITVERPLQLKFSVTPETVESWANSKNAEYVDELSKVSGEYLDIDSFLKAAGIKKPSAALIKNICKFFGKHAPEAKVICDAKGNPLPDPELRDHENVPLGEDIDEYFQREVIPHVPDAWIDTAKKDHKDGLVGVVGYEINFNRYFYEYVPPRSLEEIDADLEAVENAIAELLKKVTR